jgi:hypothetical protein
MANHGLRNYCTVRLCGMLPGMATKRTGHYGGPRPPYGWPSQQARGIALRDRELVAVIRAAAREQHTSPQAVIAERFGVTITPRPRRRRNGSQPPACVQILAGDP